MTKLSEETKKKISSSLKRQRKEHPELFPSGEEHSRKVGMGTKGKFKKISSILDVSSRTAQKIVKRLNLGCSICGWNLSTCDIHHIEGRKIENANDHSNLTLVCPNCHRCIHTGKISKDEIIPLDEYIPDNWRDFYYG